MGLNIVMNMGKHGGVYAYQLYEIAFIKGREVVFEIRRGDSLRVMHNFNDLNGTREDRKRSLTTFHPDLEPALRACAVLMEGISNRCWDMDFPKKPEKKTKKKR